MDATLIALFYRRIQRQRILREPVLSRPTVAQPLKSLDELLAEAHLSD